MIGRIGRERRSELLEAYHDGELRGLARWRLTRLLAQDAELRDELESLGRLGSLLREVDAEQPTPDLWDSLRLRLPAVDARRQEAEVAAPGRVPRWLGAGLAAVAAALALVVGLNLGPQAAAPGSLRWLDSRGNPVLVLQDDRDATIIWLLEPAPGENVSRRTGRVVG